MVGSLFFGSKKKEGIDVIFEISILGLLSLNSFLLALIAFKTYRTNKTPSEPLEADFLHSTYVIKNIIDVYKPGYNRSLYGLSKKYGVLNSTGDITAPNDSIREYKEAKEKIKAVWGKKVVNSLSKHTRDTYLRYYSSSGFVQYILQELEKD